MATLPALPVWSRARASSSTPCSLAFWPHLALRGRKEEKEPQDLLSGRMLALTWQKTHQTRGQWEEGPWVLGRGWGTRGGTYRVQEQAHASLSS